MKQVYLFLLSLIIGNGVFAQTTTLLNEGWESGTTGWTFVNHTSHQWFVGSPGANSGTNGAFISNDGGVTNAYTITTSQTSHFYYDLPIPAATFNQLSFDHRASGEANWDRLLVYIAPTSVTPVAGTPTSNSTALTGATLVAIVPASATFTTQTYTLPASFAGTTARLIFTWQNDGSGGTAPPSSVDNILVASTALQPLNGVYTIDNTQPTSGSIPAPGNFNSFNDAIAYLNMHGISGAVTFDVAAGQTFTETGKNITTTGTATDPIVFQKSGAGANPVFSCVNGIGTDDYAFAISGADYITFNGIDVVDDAANTTNTTKIEYGYLIRNGSATDGAMYNVVTNCNISLDRANTGSWGIYQSASTGQGGFTPTAATGVNSFNTYSNNNISNAYRGIYLLSNSTYADQDCLIENNIIGSATANDIGGGSTQAYGIRTGYQSSVIIRGNTVRNVTASTTTDGIFVEFGKGTITVSHNTVYDIKNSSTTSTSAVTGLRTNLSGTGTHSLYVFNNFVYGITSNYAGSASTTRQLKGIHAQSAGSGAATSTINVHFNTVRIDASSAPNISSSAFEIGTTTGPVMNVRNNIFSNFTGAQSGTPAHYAWVSTSATLVGNTGSASDYNDLYIDNTTNGFVGRGSTTNYATLANWQTATSQDANSLSADPIFVSPTDLHISSVTLNGAADMTGITWVADDIDNQTRVAPHDIGADDFTPALLDLGVTALAAPTANACYSSTEQVTVTLFNYAAAAIDFTTTPATITVNVTGAVTQTLTFTVTTNTANGGTPLASGASVNIPVGTLNMTTAGTYTFDATVTTTGDGNTANDAMASAVINVSAGTASAGATSICNGSGTTLTLTGYTGTLQWESSTDGGTNWANETGTGNTSASYIVTPTANIMYRALVCGTHISNTISVTVASSSAPVVTGDTRCGSGVVNLSASGSGTLYWFDAPTNGNIVNTGTSYAPTLTTTTTFYVANASGSGAGSVGLFDNSAGGAQQSSTAYLVFDVYIPATLDGVYAYPGAAGNVVFDLRDNTGALITTTTVAVTAGQVGTKTYIPLNFALTPGTGYRLGRGTGSVSMFRNNAGVSYPYTLPGVLSITGAQSAGFYYFAYDWSVSSSCYSSLIPVTATINPAPAITVATANSTICTFDTATIVVSSANTGYSYSWSPAASLNTASNDTVDATPAVTTTYTVEASDLSGCYIKDSVTVTVNQAPLITATSSASSPVCSGTNVQLDVNNTTPNELYTVGKGTITNGSTSYPAPYGNYYWGARHQFLITAAELTASGLTAGPIDALGFDVSALNAVPALTNFSIYVGTTTITAITAFQTGLTQVYTNASYTPTSGWNMHTFSTPFIWNGTDNIVVETCFNNSGWTSNGNASFNQTSTAYTSSVWYRADNATVCGSTTTTSTAMQRPNIRLMRTPSFTYSWNPAATLSSGTIANPVATPTTTTTYTASVTNTLNGCVISSPVTVTVNPLPVVTLTAPAAVCADASSFTITGESPSGGTFSGAGVSGSTFDPATAGVGTHTVTYNYTDANNCSNSASATFTVNALPTVTLASQPTVCADASAFTITGETPTGGTFSGTGVSGSSFDPSAAGAGTHTVTYTYTDANNCSNTANATVTVNALPTVTFTTTPSVCEDAASFAITGESPTGGTFSGTGVSGSNFDPATAGVGTHTVTYSYTDANSCTNTASSVFTVNALPTVTLSSLGQVCIDAAPFTITGESPSGGTFSGTGVSAGMFDAAAAGQGTHTVTYTYSDANSCTAVATATISVNALPAVIFSGSSVVCDNAAPFTISGALPSGGTFSGTGVVGNDFDPAIAGAGTHNITYTYTDGNNCSNFATSTFTVNAAPVVNLGTDIVQCGDSAVLDAANAGNTYSWSTTETTQTITVTTSGIYSVVVTDANTCSGTDTINVTFNQAAPVVLGADTTICDTDSLMLDAGSGYTTYMWSDNSAAQTLTVNASGNYYVSVTDANGCQASDTINVTVTVCAGIAEVKQLSVSVMPNPSKGLFTLNLNNTDASKLNIQVMDAQGKMVYSISEGNIAGQYTKVINLKDVAQGIYYLRVIAGEKVVTEKLIVQ